jgi:hypothetical protein
VAQSAQVALPEAYGLTASQGWTYSSGDPGTPDMAFFSANGSQLHMDTVGSGYSGHAYIRDTVINASTPFTLSVRLRVTGYEDQSGGHPYGFDLSVLTGT